MVGMRKKLEIARRIKSVRDKDEPEIWTSGDADTVIETYYKHKTINKIFDDKVKEFAHLPCMGTRELLSEVDEVQPNGKVFKKAIFGKYNWMTFQEVGDKVDTFAKGLTGLYQICLSKHSHI